MTWHSGCLLRLRFFKTGRSGAAIKRSEGYPEPIITAREG
jgi:hypothetical protein